MKITKAKIYIALIVVLALFAIAGTYLSDGSTNRRNEVSLKAKSWNEGIVHVWNNLKEDASTIPVDLADGTRCTRMDDEMWKMGSGDTVIFYYKLDCNGVIGYVETDQVR